MSDIEGVGYGRDQWSDTPPTPSSGVTEGKAENGYPFMTVQDAIETAILARGVDVPDLADVVFVAAEAVQALWPPAPSDEGQARVLRDLVAWRAGFHAIDTARGSGRFTAVREALTELELIVDRADAALVTPATEGEALSGAVSAHVSKLLDVWRRQRSIVRPDEKIPTPLAVALDCLMNAVWLEKRTAQPPAPAGDAATDSIEKRMERPGAPDWGGEEALDGGEPIYHHAWDSDDGELRLWVGPYEGHRDRGWAVMVSGAGVDLVLRSDPDQILEWTVMVRQAIEGSRPRLALPAAPDAAEVLAGLLAGFEHERWWSADDEVKFEIWTKAMKRVEAAQQRLAERGQSDMPDES